MASESIATLILFIAAMVVAAGVAGTLVTNVNDVSSSIDDYSSDVSDKIDTDVEIISDPGSEAVYNGTETEVTLLVKNTGRKTLADDGSDLDILVDGDYVARDDVTVTVPAGGGDEPWRRGVVAEVAIDRQLDGGAEYRIVVDANGDREVFEFYVP